MHYTCIFLLHSNNHERRQKICKKFTFYLVNPKKCITFASSKTKYRMAVDDLLP